MVKKPEREIERERERERDRDGLIFTIKRQCPECALCIQHYVTTYLSPPSIFSFCKGYNDTLKRASGA